MRVASPTAGKQEGALVIGSSIVAGFGAKLYGVPPADYFRWATQPVPTPPGSPQVVTFDGATGRVSLPGHTFGPGVALVFAGGSPPPEITPGVAIFVANPDVINGTFQVYTQYLPSLSGAHIPTFTGNGTGTTTATRTSTAGRPYEFKMPGVRLVTPRRPWCNNTTRPMGDGVLANAFKHQGAEIPSPIDQWLFVNRGVARGNIRRIVDYVSLSSILVCNSNLSPYPALGDEIVILQDAHTLLSLSADGLTITQTNAGPVFVDPDVGRFCSFFDSSVLGETTRKIVARTDRTLTFDLALPAFPCASAALGAAPVVVTFNDAADRVNHTAHGYANGQALILEGSGAPPSGVSTYTAVYACNVTANDYQLALTRALALAGTNFTFSGSGTGTTTARPLPTFDNATHRVILPGHGIPTGAGGVGTALVFEGGTTPATVPTRTVVYATDVLADSFKLSATWADALTPVTLTFATTGNGITTCKVTVNGFAVLRGANACHNIATMQPPNVVLQDCTFTLNEVAPVYLTGLDYTNWDVGTPFASPRSLSRDPSVNLVPELAFHVKSRIDQPLVLFELGVSASMLSTFAMPREFILPNVGPIHDLTSLDWSPTSPGGIYDILVAGIQAMQALVAAEPGAPQLEIKVVFVNLTDNDFEPQRRRRVGANMTLLRDEVRQLVAQVTGQATPPDWVMSGPARYMGGPSNNGDVYAQLEAMAAADPKGTTVVNTQSYDEDDTLFADDDLHLSALGEIRIAQDLFDGWLTLDPGMQTDAAAGDSADDGGGSEDDGADGSGTDTPLTEQSAQDILDVIDTAVKDGADVAEYEVNGRRVRLRGLDELLKARRFYQAEAAKASGLRRTRVGFRR